jgi:hypothetical protein
MEGMKLIYRLVKKEGFDLKMKISSLREWVTERVSVQEIHVEWRIIAESILLMSLSIILYCSIVFTQFTFVPIMIITIKRGWKEACLYLTGAFILFFYLLMHNSGQLPIDSSLLLFSPTHYSFDFLGDLMGLKEGRFLDYFFFFGVLGIFLGHLVSKNYRLNYVLFLSLVVYVGIVIFTLALSGIFGSFELFMADYARFVDRKTDSYVILYLNQMENYRNTLVLQGVDYSVVEKKIEIAAEMYKKGVIFGIAPKGGYLIKQIVIMFISLIFVKLYFKNKLNRAAFTFNLRNYTLDNDWVWALIVAWGLVFINLYLRSPLLGIISWNSSVIVSFLFFLKGLAIIKIAVEKLKIPILLEYGILLFLLFYVFIFFITIVTSIGVIDIWLNIRENVEKINRRSAS